MLLFLSDVGGSEVLLIFLVILIFFGPKSIPGIAKTFGRAIYQIKQASDDIKKEVVKSGLDIKQDMNFDQILNKAERGIEKEIMRPMEREVNDVDRTLHSVSYTKTNHNTAYKGEAEIEAEREEAEALKAIAAKEDEEKLKATTENISQEDIKE